MNRLSRSSDSINPILGRCWSDGGVGSQSSSSALFWAESRDEGSHFALGLTVLGNTQLLCKAGWSWKRYWWAPLPKKLRCAGHVAGGQALLYWPLSRWGVGSSSLRMLCGDSDFCSVIPKRLAAAVPFGSSVEKAHTYLYGVSATDHEAERRSSSTMMPPRHFEVI